MPKKFSREFKQDLVADALRGDLSMAEMAVNFGIAEESVRRWMRQVAVKDGLTSSAQAEMVQLRRRMRMP